MSKYIIGLGCSWTQGEGGYPQHIWEQYNGRPQISLRGHDDYHIRHYEHENSWVNQLARDHFPDHTPINLGVKGIGNTAAVNQLHFCDKVDWDNSEGIIVLMLSGFERLDTFQQNPYYNNNQDDGYSNGEYVHYKWRTAWPFDSDSLYWKAYAKELYSEQFVASHAMMALLNAQTFARSVGYKLIVANAFNQVEEGDLYKYLNEQTGSLVDKFDWSQYLHNTTDYKAFMQKLIWLDGIMDPDEWGAYHNFYFKRDYPSKYLTNCEGAHPTIDGYKVIADELSNHIKYKGYA